MHLRHCCDWLPTLLCMMFPHCMRALTPDPLPAWAAHATSSRLLCGAYVQQRVQYLHSCMACTGGHRVICMNPSGLQDAYIEGRIVARRRDGSYIIEEFLTTGGTDVKARPPTD